MTTTTDMTATPDLAAVKARQQMAWSAGDYSVIGARIAVTSERLVDTADLRSGSAVLDVACGSGNAALAAARAGCRVTGVDYVPALLERARMRAAAEGLPLHLLEGDAEDLPVRDAAMDATLSVFGAMFAPDQRRTAGEMMRVTRPGGTIATASWTGDGFIGALFRTVAAHVPPPAGVASPMLWGDEGHVESLFAPAAATIRSQRRTYVFRYPSAEAFVEEFRDLYGPVNRAFAAAGDAAPDLEADLLALVRAHDRRGDGAVAVPSTYLETVVTRA